MRIISAKDYNEMSHIAAMVISSQVMLKPDSILGLATGSTPIGIYDKLVRSHNQDGLDFSHITTINLDEYVGLRPDDPLSYNYFMRKHLIDRINIDARNMHIPNGLETDEKKECSRYDALIKRLGGIDLQLLGIGHNGHIGFNEPGESFSLGTNMVTLTQSTIDANARFFERKEDVPTKAYTMGIGSIMSARLILVVVSGEGKAEAVKKAFSGPIKPHVPASILRLHSNVILVGDEASLSLL